MPDIDYIDYIDFKKGGGLVPVVTQDFETGQVLMMAYANDEAWRKTLETNVAHYWSRSRNQLWKKGETSGNIQKVKEIRVDCDFKKMNDDVYTLYHKKSCLPPAAEATNSRQ